MSDTPRIDAFLREHDCGKYVAPYMHYGDDWSHEDIFLFVEFARALEKEAEALRVEYESRAEWIKKMNTIIGYDNSDGFHCTDPHEIATAKLRALDEANGKLAKLCRLIDKTLPLVNSPGGL